MTKAQSVLMVGLALFMALLALAADSDTDKPVAADSDAGDWLSGDTMTGDWGGIRSDIADKGITFDIDNTIIFQNNAHGGANTTNAARASGSYDLELGLDFGKMGLWEGGSLLLHAEGVWGGGSIARSVPSFRRTSMLPCPVRPSRASVSTRVAVSC